MSYEVLGDYEREFIYKRDILMSEYFINIRDIFSKKMEEHFSDDILPIKKNKLRVYHNMFAQWYFWECYNKSYSRYPLLIEPDYSYETIYQVLSDYDKSESIKERTSKFIKDLDLEGLFIKSIKKLDSMGDINILVSIKRLEGIYMIIINGVCDKYMIKISENVFNKIRRRLSMEKSVALVFRYYALSSNNNQLAVSSDIMSNIECDVELFASGFNNYFGKFCSIFPDLEKDLGSIGRFQDMKIKSGRYEINPPFQTTIIYDILRRVRRFIEDREGYISFDIILPNWDRGDKRYDEYLVRRLLNEIDGVVLIENKSNIEFPYYDYWKEIKRDITLPDSYYIKVINY